MRHMLIALLFLPLSALAQWTKIADENGSATLSAPSTVRYGAGAKWNQKDMPAGLFACTNAVFGDPIEGTVKTCERLTPAQTALPACWPKEVAGTGSQLLRWEGQKGRVSYWYCPDRTYHGWACRFSFGNTCTYLPSPGMVFNARVDSLASMWREFVTSDWRSPEWADITPEAFRFIEANAPK